MTKRGTQGETYSKIEHARLRGRGDVLALCDFSVRVQLFRVTLLAYFLALSREPSS
jgi:hypothetical protein